MGWEHTYNVTKAIAAFPCAQPNPIILAVTIVPAIAPALFEWAGFGCRDILKFRLGHGVPCGRAMKGQVAKAIPPSFRSAAGTLMKFEHAFSYAGQMFLLSDLASDFVARWTTLAYQLNECPDALDGAAWQVEWTAPAALLPGVPTPVGGRITHETGRPGIAWPTGAIVPNDWYFQAEFTASAIGLYDRLPAQLTTWIQRTSPNPYDYPGQTHPTGYYFQHPEYHYFLHEVQNDTHGSAQYTYMVMSDRLALVDSFKASAQASPGPMADWTLSPLSCFRDLLSEHVPNPAGRNKRSGQPGMLDKFVRQNAPRPRRGPPGGKPRSRK